MNREKQQEMLFMQCTQSILSAAWTATLFEDDADGDMVAINTVIFSAYDELCEMLGKDPVEEKHKIAEIGEAVERQVRELCPST